MKWLRLTSLGLCLGYLAAAPADDRADEPPSYRPRAVPASAVPAFKSCAPPRPEQVVVPSGGAGVPTFVPCRSAKPGQTPAAAPAPAAPVRPVVAVESPRPAVTVLTPVAGSAYPPPSAVRNTVVTIAAPPKALSAVIVRGQMGDTTERVLPSGAELAAAQAKPFATLGGPVTPVQAAARPIMPVQATTGDEPATDPSKAFIAPQPRTYPRYDAASTVITGLPVVGTPVIYEAGPGTVFSDPITNPRFWARAEFLLWWTNGYRLPVLVTTSPATTPQALQGVLGVPGTTVLYGGNNTNSGPIPGGRFTFGWNLDPCGTCGIFGSYFFLGRKNDNFYAAGPVLARPFFNINTGTPDRELTSSPGTNAGDVFKLRGSIAVNNSSDFQGGDINLSRLLCADCNYWLYGFAGFRYLDLREKLTITENVVSAAAVPGFPIFNPGNQIVVQDSFATRNQFYGGQVGVYGEVRRSRWFVGTQVQVGLGVNHETITVNGSQTVTTLAGAQQTFNGGLLALPSNIGVFTANKFSVVPQVGLRVGYALTDNMRVFVGYDFLYWSNVVRPGDQVDTALNVNQIPNFATPGLFPPSPLVHPVVPFRTSGFIAQGLSAGFEWRY